ncbi:MAG: hypothetical protein V3S70_10605 [Gammaproteobacteria bacterium]|jgi:hypothetical protein
MKRGHKLLAVEVKSGARFSTIQLSGLRAIEDLPHVARRILVYGGRRTLRTSDGIEVWPVETLIEALERNRLWG